MDERVQNWHSYFALVKVAVNAFDCGILSHCEVLREQVICMYQGKFPIFLPACHMLEKGLRTGKDLVRNEFTNQKQRCTWIHKYGGSKRACDLSLSHYCVGGNKEGEKTISKWLSPPL